MFQELKRDNAWCLPSYSTMTASHARRCGCARPRRRSRPRTRSRSSPCAGSWPGIPAPLESLPPGPPPFLRRCSPDKVGGVTSAAGQQLMCGTQHARWPPGPLVTETKDVCGWTGALLWTMFFFLPKGYQVAVRHCSPGRFVCVRRPHNLQV